MENYKDILSTSSSVSFLTWNPCPLLDACLGSSDLKVGLASELRLFCGWWMIKIAYHPKIGYHKTWIFFCPRYARAFSLTFPKVTNFKDINFCFFVDWKRTENWMKLCFLQIDFSSPHKRDEPPHEPRTNNARFWDSFCVQSCKFIHSFWFRKTEFQFGVFFFVLDCFHSYFGNTHNCLVSKIISGIHSLSFQNLNVFILSFSPYKFWFIPFRALFKIWMHPFFPFKLWIYSL